MADTTNYGWEKPNVGGSAGSWGTLLNTVIDAVDAALFAVSTTATAALPKAGGTLTGIVEILTDRYHVVDLGGSLVSGVTIDCSLARFFRGVCSGGVTFTITNAPTSGKACVLTLELTNAGVVGITWPASVKWPNGSAPTLTASGTDVITLYTRDGGTTWRGALAMRDSK
jgi:hypothetical protein